ncbi:Cyclic pyranopterin monophosphate synthase [compost metagenome]
MTVTLLKTTPTNSIFGAGPKIQAPMIDKFGRAVTYLRVSVTDRCDFRCSYCMAESMTFLPKKDLLSLDELDRLCSAFVAKGVRKLRLTGGEPLVRSIGRHMGFITPMPHNSARAAIKSALHATAHSTCVWARTLPPICTKSCAPATTRHIWSPPSTRQSPASRRATILSLTAINGLLSRGI